MSEQTVPSSAARAGRQPHGERRVAVRYPSGREGTCRTVSARAGDSWPATVKDVSVSGVGLLLARRFEPGIILAVELPAEGGARAVLARVAHATAVGEGAWLVGCRFLDPLTEEDLQPLL